VSSSTFQKKWAALLEALSPRWNALRVRLMANPFLTALGFILIVWFVVGAVEYNIEASAKDGNIKSLEDGIWWGIVTLLTVGYGDRFPVTTSGRILGGILMMAGVVGIAVITAKISSYFLERALRERRGFVDTQTLKNHFVICGWKAEMSHFLLHMLDSNQKIKDSDLVLLNSAPDGEIEALLAISRLKNVKVIRGDFYIEMNLKRAAPERATKILILADATPNAAGSIPTLTEADARTIMTAMTLNNIARGTPIVAEILDSAMDQYLKLAHVNEIIYSRDYSRLLLAMAATGTGVTNVFHDLLNPHSPFFLTTKPVPEAAFNQPYDKFQQLFHKLHPHDSVIGILENSGNSHLAKEVAIRKAQQTPNVAELVANLREVKALRFNQPQFGPPPEYIVREGAMAIVIENRGVGHG
jgi:voltage-gated potassium channel